MSATTMDTVPGGLYWKTRLVSATRPIWEWLGRLESAVLREEIDARSVDRPIYVTSLARSGTTIITELLHAHPDTTAHHYADFPFVDIPYWRNWLHERTRLKPPQRVERAHRDRLMVTEDSPEAVEELLWMRAFPKLHDPEHDQRLGPEHDNKVFNATYRDHVRKLLLVRGADRYVAKGNYNIARIGYLLSLFDDARFVIPIRNPVDHLASLAKQHTLFSRAQQRNRRVLTQLSASGHFEFGLGRRAVHLGDDDRAEAIGRAWNEGSDARGWALYWDSVYSYLADLKRSNPALERAMLFVRYEDLCAEPAVWIDRIVEHAALDATRFGAARDDFMGRLKPPTYYQPAFSDGELETIRTLTAATAARFGY